MNTRLLMTMHVKVGAVLNIGAVPYGTRRTAPLGGGTFEGPRLRGTIFRGSGWRRGGGLTCEDHDVRTAHPAYVFLNRLIAVASGDRRPGRPDLHDSRGALT